ncbi:hypothetical protein WOC76_11565 [Methylocystis sp. IM3]|jgi:Arc/MetJ family transcription regulator|uniref:hypothetical protein n=1 Tax=unclassified Methylocystis TaxID=2625913 RepID=UPI00268715A4
MPRRNVVIVAAALSGVLLTGAYAVSQDQAFVGDLFRALFGLSGGNTAGGQ